MLYHTEAEQYLIGSILLENDLLKECSLMPENFYHENFQMIFRAMKEAEQHDEPADIVSVVQYLGNEKTKKIGGTSFLESLRDSIPTTENFHTYEKYILNSWKMRQAILICLNAKEKLELSQDISILTDIILELSKIEEQGFTQDFNITKALADLMMELEEGKTGILSGFTDLDLFTNGFHDGDLIIIGARPSMGKTAFAGQLALNAAKNGVVTTIFSLEMASGQILKRMLSNIGKIDSYKLREPKKFENEGIWDQIVVATGDLAQLPLHIYDEPAIPLQTIRSKIRRLKRRYPDKKHICFIDYLTLIKTNERQNRTVEIGEISRGLKAIAREFNMPIVALSQLSRSVEQRQNKRPLMSDLRESGEIEQDADLILFLYRDEYYNPKTQDKNIVEVNIAKQRNGEVGTIKLYFQKEYSRFENLAKGMG